MKKIKSITFDKEAQDNLPKDIKDKMKSDRAKAEKEQQSKGLNIPDVIDMFDCPCCKSTNTANMHLDGVRCCLDCDADWAI